MAVKRRSVGTWIPSIERASAVYAALVLTTVFLYAVGLTFVASLLLGLAVGLFAATLAIRGFVRRRLWPTAGVVAAFAATAVFLALPGRYEPAGVLPGVGAIAVTLLLLYRRKL